MDYLNFDYKKACSELTVRELETLLFKSRMLGVTKIITGCWKKYKPDDLIFITLFILYTDLFSENFFQVEKLLSKILFLVCNPLSFQSFL